MKNYRKKAIDYFELEYSDFCIDYLIGNIRIYLKDQNKFVETKIDDLKDRSLRTKNITKWWNKIEQIISDYEAAKKRPEEASRKIASLLKTITRQKTMIRL